MARKKPRVRQILIKTHKFGNHIRRSLKKQFKRRPLGSFVLTAVVMTAGFLGLVPTLNPKNPVVASERFHSLVSADLQAELQILDNQIAVLQDSQARNDIKVAPDTEIQAAIAAIFLDISARNTGPARTEINTLKTKVKVWQQQLAIAIDQKRASEASKITMPPHHTLTVPILIYHDTPSDFNRQIQTLISRGYNSIDLDQLSAALRQGAPLPPKPVVISFDDGFANQMEAFKILKAHNFKATFYVMPGGEASSWCIGANRRNYSCGDSYLNWDQIREIDASGLITIAAHTVDHANLPTKSVAEQRFQVFESKSQIEAQLGHPIRHFAYPYGAFNATIINLAREAGYLTAVSTLPGSVQTLDNIYVLRRVRDPYTLH